MRPTSPLRVSDFLSLDDDVAIEIAESEASVLQNLYKIRRKLVRRKGTLPLAAAQSPDQDLNGLQWAKFAAGAAAEEALVAVHNGNVDDWFAPTPGTTIPGGGSLFTNNDVSAAWLNQELYLGDGTTQNQYISLKAGNALALNGSNQYLSIASNASLTMQNKSFTIAGWMKITGTPTNPSVLVCKGNSVAEYEVSYNSATSNWFFHLISSGVDHPASVNLPASLGVWYFICAWVDLSGPTVSISINNGAAGSAACPVAGADATGGEFDVGFRTAATQFLQGDIDSLGVWSRALTAAERTTLYNNGTALSYRQVADSLLTGLVSWWDMDETSGTRFDATATGNNLTQHNTPGTVTGSGTVLAVQQAMVGPPTAACTAAAGGAGSGTGNFTFVYCYLAANGQISEPSPVSNQVTLAAQKANLTGVTVSTEPGVTARYIFATGGTRTDYVLVDILADNVTTSVTVNLDGIINPFSPLIFGNTRFPPCRYLIEHQSRLIGAWCATSEGDKQTVYISNLLAPWYAPAAPDLDIAANGTQAQLQGAAAGEITGLCGHGDYVAVMTGGAGFWLIGTEAADFRLQLFSNHGCVAHRTAQSTRHLLLWLANDGVYSWNGTAVERISDLVRETIAGMSATDMAKAFAFVWYDRYYLCWPGNCLFFDLLTRTWGSHTQWDWRCSTVTTFVAGAQQRVYAAQTGHARVWQLETGSTDNGVAIPVVWQSRDWECGLPTHEKRVHYVEAKLKKSTGTATIKLYRGTGDLIQTITQDLSSVDFADSEVVRILESAAEQAIDENFRIRVEYSGTGATFELLSAGLQWTPGL